VKDDERSGCPTIRTDDIAAVDKMVKEDRKVTSRLKVDTLGIPNFAHSTSSSRPEPHS
jgi:hypothetical protein